jgi:TetR/AcrR family transcriptional repressor of bet genes
VTTRKKNPKPRATVPRVRTGRGRQRQRLIDACIAALHLYGPSRTTVEKVVAIARMSPGIVRFYFDSKAAMLVASLNYLAAEFEQRVMVPVAALKATPVAALELLVDLYLDPEIASARKVSVWYAFWGEASARQEYYDICGQKDAGATALVRKLIVDLIAATSQPHLDADGIALGLIGVLEILWQDIAFQTERDIDRGAARRRAMAFLGSIFPGHFDAAPAGARPEARAASRRGDALFNGAWTVVGHDAQIPHVGDFLAADLGADGILLVRSDAGSVRALVNRCTEAAHALVDRRSGRFEGPIACRVHGVAFGWDGRRARGPGRSDLASLDVLSVGGLLFVHRPPATP